MGPRGSLSCATITASTRSRAVTKTIGALVAVVLLAQMDRTTNSLSRQMTISAFATFIGDVFAHPSHFPPQWGEPLVTAVVSAAIAVAVWYVKRLALKKRLSAAPNEAQRTEVEGRYD
jgi:hypothetical protein